MAIFCVLPTQQYSTVVVQSVARCCSRKRLYGREWRDPALLGPRRPASSVAEVSKAQLYLLLSGIGSSSRGVSSFFSSVLRKENRDSLLAASVRFTVSGCLRDPGELFALLQSASLCQLAPEAVCSAHVGLL